MQLLEYISFLLLSSVKFFFFYPVFITKEDYNFLEAMTFGLTAGFIGSSTFIFFGDVMYQFFHRLALKKAITHPPKEKKQRSIKHRRLIVKLRDDYGLWGIAFLAPILITIPLACILATRFYHNKGKILGHFMIAIAFWSALIYIFKSSLIHLIS
ncbi:hypothetical protein [Solitalea lacus]|uniref:hypothetical protein n=1 Tax=Solitalea lacus TaxID=2911172 RepID=UPI001EDB748C|nr:hypothetical protein [Solitalea lacus]UKJ08700.1 hypothetical protein L2B55_05905 [Solitalea lacus]